ncbi:MAG: cysteine-rich CWC family protein [Thermoplasmataceae archaeon]
MATKVCDQCGESFLCCDKSPCWCTFKKVTETKLRYLKEKSKDCVCPRCLGD